MAAFISFQPTDFFNTKLYDGNNSTQEITGVGFQSDLTWIKCRNNTDNHAILDSVRGATKYLSSNTTTAETTLANSLTAWGSDGFTCGDANLVNGGTGRIYTSWNWKMGTTSGLSGGTITPSSYSFDTTAGQSVIAYTGTGSAATVPHGLGTTPGLIICKRLDGADNWWVHIKSMTGPQYMVINGTGAVATATAVWNDTLPTSTVFSIGTDGGINASGGTYIAYCFAPKKGYSKMGYYRGNASSTDGPFVYTGFRPAYVVIKALNQTTDWIISDSKREGYNVDNDPLYTDVDVAEGTANNLDLLSNGFKIRNGSGGGSVNEINTSGENYLYFAFAEFPLVSSNSKAGTAR